MSYQELINQTLSLLQEETVILASPDDALYFRKNIKKHSQVQPPIKKVPLQKIATPAPEKKEPLKKEEPAPTAWQTQEKSKDNPLELQSTKALFRRVFPNISIIDEIPSDAMAKKIANRWKTKNQAAPISILYGYESPNQKKFLEQIVKAIDVHFGPANLINAQSIEKENQWDAFLSSQELKYVIACDYTLWQLHSLMSHYKEVPAAQTRTLKNKPLFLLPDLSLYLKDPLLKRSLWKALCRIL